MNLQLHHMSGERGFSLVELLIAISIMMIAIGPIVDTITASLLSADAGKENTIFVNYARQKMEDVLAMNFNDVAISSPLGTPTALSDTVAVSGSTVNRDVFVEL